MKQQRSFLNSNAFQARDEQTRKRAEMLVAGASAVAATKQCGVNNNKGRGDMLVAKENTTDGVGGTTVAPAAVGGCWRRCWKWKEVIRPANKNDVDGTVREGWDARTLETMMLMRRSSETTMLMGVRRPGSQPATWPIAILKVADVRGKH